MTDTATLKAIIEHVSIIIVAIVTGAVTVTVTWINKRAIKQNTKTLEVVHDAVNSRYTAMEKKIVELKEELRYIKEKKHDSSSCD